MSLKEENDVVLRTADQYELWKCRIHATCWAKTQVSIFQVTMNEFTNEIKRDKNKKDKDKEPSDWVGKCWMLITRSLHNELFLKVAHVQAGHIPALLEEIRMALLVNMSSDAQTIKLELYACTMASCGNDLQTFISGLKQKRDKLAFLKEKIDEKELTAIMLRGLHPIFQPVCRRLFLVPLKKP